MSLSNNSKRLLQRMFSHGGAYEEIIGKLEGTIDGLTATGEQLNAAAAGELPQLNVVKPESFSFVVIPDPQFLTGGIAAQGGTLRENPNAWKNLYEFIIARKDAWNIKAVTTTGDMVDGVVDGTYGAPAVARLMTGVNAIVAAGVPFYPCLGNHEYDGTAGVVPATSPRDATGTVDTNFPTTFISDQTATYDFFDDTGATHENSVANYCVKQTIGSQKFLFIILEVFPRNIVVDWAKTVVAANSNHYVIVVSHSILRGVDGEFSVDGDTYGAAAYQGGFVGSVMNGQELWDNLLKVYPNIILAVCGHDEGTVKFAHRSDTGTNGNTVHTIFCDYQGTDWTPTAPFAGILRLTFYPDVSVVDVEPISTVTGFGDPNYPKITLSLPTLTPVGGSGEYFSAVCDANGNICTTYGQTIGWGAIADEGELPSMTTGFICTASGVIDARATIVAQGLRVRDAYGNYASITHSHKDTTTTDNRLHLNVGETHAKGLIIYNADDAAIVSQTTHASVQVGTNSITINPPTAAGWVQFNFGKGSAGTFFGSGTSSYTYVAHIGTQGDIRLLDGAKVGWGANAAGDKPAQTVYFTRAAAGPVLLNAGLGITSAVAGSAGGLVRKIAEATATLSGGTTAITLGIPTNCRLLGCQLRVETAITSDNATKTWAAAYSGGSTTSLTTGQLFTKDVRVDKLHADEITSNTTNVTISAAAGSFTAGVVRAIAYYEELTALPATP